MSEDESDENIESEESPSSIPAFQKALLLASVVRRPKLKGVGARHQAKLNLANIPTWKFTSPMLISSRKNCLHYLLNLLILKIVRSIPLHMSL